MQQIHIIDSHTGGEPTRLVVDGGPELGRGSVATQLRALSEQHDWLRRATVNEPRGNDVIVGALLCQPGDPTCSAGVIFFNNVGYLGMCGHGTIGLMASLAYLGRIAPGTHRVETPVGVVEATLHPLTPTLSPLGRGSQSPLPVGEGQGAGAGEFEYYPTRVSVRNVPSYRHAKNVLVLVDGLGKITGDVAWGGNWFFLIHEHGQTLRPSNIETLTRFCARIKDALQRGGIIGVDGAEIDHIELFGKSDTADSKSFVLCPGNAYDRSPCGTGTSAKLACLYADGKLAPGQIWRQESIIGSTFEGSIEVNRDGSVTPTITGEAFVTADATLLLDPRDPLRYGVSSVNSVAGVDTSGH
jgi:4-hydroxyproline epimerase